MNAADSPGANFPVVPHALAGSAVNPRPIQAIEPSSSLTPADLVDASTSLDPAALLRGLQRRWKLALVLSVLAAAGAAGLTWCLVKPAKYTAVATLQVQQEEPRLVLTTQENKTRFELFQRTQNGMIKSRLVLDTVIKDPKVANLETIHEATQESQGDPVEWLAKEVNVDFPPGSQLLQIALSGQHPADLPVLVNMITDTYMRLVVDRAYNERISRVETLRKLYGKYQEDMKTRREQIRKLALVVGSDDRRTLAMKSQLAHQQLAMIQQQQLQVKSELIRQKALAAVRKDRSQQPESAAEQGDLAAVERALENHPQVMKLRESLQMLSQRYHNAVRLAKLPSDPSRVALRKQLDENLERPGSAARSCVPRSSSN